MSVRPTSNVLDGRRRRWTLMSAVSVASLVLIAVPAGAEPSGTVDATVEVEGPCITVSAATTDFGTLGFSSVDTNTVASSDSIGVSNCSSQFQDIYAAATDASGDASGSRALNQWDESVLACSWGVDSYGAGLRHAGAPLDHWLSSTADSYIWSIPSGIAILWLDPLLLMPCSGSNGVAEVMTFSYTITGVLP